MNCTGESSFPGVKVEARAYDPDDVSMTTFAVTVASDAPTKPGSPGGGDDDVLTSSCSAGTGSGASGGLLARLALGLVAFRSRRG